MENFNAALGQTLIHSLWQGAILAGITGLIVIFTRNAKAANRYLLLVGTLLLFAIVSVGTFCYELYQPVVKATSAQIIYHVSGIPKISAAEQSLPRQLMKYVDNHTQIIVYVWFFIVLARSLQLATGLHNLYLLRSKKLLPADEVWSKRMEALAYQLGIKRMIKIAESGIAKVPMVIGHLKPLILIPAGLLTALPPTEIEAILIHELAHIQRRDYLINLFQSLLEIIFFFNPAVLWLSSLIRTERENCCDDIAIQQTSSKVNYIKALVSCQEYQLSAPSYAMAFQGKRNELMGRVKRMASGTNYALNFRERSILFVILVTAGLLTLAFTNVKQIQHFAVKTQKEIISPVVPARDTTLIPTQQPTKKVKWTSSAKPLKSHQEEIKILEPEDTTVSIHKKMAYEDSLKQSRLAPISPIRTQTQPLLPSSSQISPLKGKLSQVAAKSSTFHQANYVPYRPTKADLGARVTADLIKDEIINSDYKNLSFKLSNNELIVNGVKQPEEVQKRYKDKFIPVTSDKNTWTLYSNYDTSSDDKK